MDVLDYVDVREALDAIARNNTFFHRNNDLDISFEQIGRAAKSNDMSEKLLMWVSYPGGIDCYPEREALQRDTRWYNGVLYHGEQMPDDRRLAYAVEVVKITDGKIYGTLFETDIREYAAKIRENAVASDSIRIYELSGRETTMPRDEFDRRYPLDVANVAHWRHEPADMEALHSAIDAMWDSRDTAGFKEKDFWLHVSNLYDSRDVFYSDQIMRDMNKLREPNSPDKRSFVTSLNSYIAAAFNPEELSRLLDKLPYQNAEFSIKKGQRYMQVIIPSEEVLQYRREQQGNPPVIKGDKDKTAAAPQDDKKELPEKPSILEALKRGAEKSRQQDNNKDKPKKSKGMEI